MSNGGRTALPFLAVLLAVTSACARVDPVASPAPPTSLTADQTFLLLNRGQATDYEPAASPADLATQSESVVLGTLREVREGRMRGSSRDDPVRVEYLTYVFDVVEQRKGPPSGAVVYVESMKPGFAPAAEIDAVAPHGAEAVLYLRRATPFGPEHTMFPPPQPLPPDAFLNWFTTPQGFQIWVNGQVVSLLAGPARPLFPLGDPDPTDIRAWLPPQ